MTTITYKENGVIFDGHAENPVVCHGISAVSQMVANFVEDRNWGEVIRKDGHLEIRDIKKECCSSELFQAMVIAIEDIANQYPNSIKIERGQKGGDPVSPYGTRGEASYFYVRHVMTEKSIGKTLINGGIENERQNEFKSI